MLSDKKIAIVYDWIDKWGGVERVLLTLHEIFPQAKFYTSYINPQGGNWAKDLNIKTSFIQQLPAFIKNNRIRSLPFYPLAFERYDLNNYDIVISVSSSFAKSVIAKPGTFHISYLLTPTRFLWIYPEFYTNNWRKILFSPFINHLKSWDYTAAQRPDKIISISQTVADRCRRFYQRKSTVIYPPFDIDYWSKIKSQVPSSKFQTNSKIQIPKKYYLVVSRLEPYKKIDLVVQSFNRLHSELIIVGEGTQEDKLKKMAGRNIMFLNRLTDEELAWLYQHAEALIMPQEEDFGYTAVEAQFFGCPVIAYRKGGAVETIVEGKTGIFFDIQNTGALEKALARFHTISYNLKESTGLQGVKNAEKFSKIKFISNFLNLFK